MEDRESAENLRRTGVTIVRAVDGSPMCLVGACGEDAIREVQTLLEELGIWIFWSFHRGEYGLYAGTSNFQRATDLVAGLARQEVCGWNYGTETVGDM